MDSIKMTTKTQLPQGWEIKRLGDVLQIQNGYAFKSTEFIKENAQNLHIPLIRQSQLIGNTVDLSDCVFLDKKYLLEKKNYIVNKGDILIGMSGSIGKVSFYENDYPALLNQRVGKLNLYSHSTFQKEFFAYLLISLEQNIIQMAKGMGVQNISSKDIERLEISIPPIETQTAIVNKIESLFAEIDAGIASLKTAQQQLKHYRQSLLKNAFNGELTKQWRLEQADRLPSANELLAQIQAVREQHHAQQLADWKAAVQQWEQAGKQGKKPSKPKAPTQAVKFEENFSSYYPYIRIPVGFFIEPAKYGTSQKCEYEKYENSTGVIRIPNITENGLIDLEDMKYAKFSTEEKEDYALKEGDLLLIRSNGSVNIVGSVGLVGKEETNYIYAGYLIRLRPIQSIVNSKFLTFAFQCLDTRTQIEFKAKSTSGVNNINAQEVQDLQINIFSLAEQTQIVAILESKLTACDQLTTELATQLKQAELLKQAVLKSAFSGSLLDK